MAGGYDIKILHTSGVQKRVDYIFRDALILDLLNPKLLDLFEHLISPLAFTELYFDFVSLAP